MKKLWKKLLAVTTAVMMAITLLPAMANAESTITGERSTGKLTINKTTKEQNDDGSYKPLSGATFTIYKVANLTVGANGIYKSWQLTSDFTSLDLTQDTLGSISTAKLEEKASDAKTIAANLTGESKVTDAAGQAVFKDLDLGYYLVVETGTPEKFVASKPFFVSIPTTVTTDAGSTWNYEVSVSPKNEGIPDIDKVADKKTVGVGDEVTYTITGSTIPNYDESYNKDTLSYVITDTLSEGLTFDKATADLKVYSTDEGTPFTAATADADNDYTYNYDADAHKITISLNKDKIVAEKGKKIYVKYKVTVNEKAVVGSSATTNTAEVRYTNNPDGSTTGSSKTEKVYSFQIKINKKDDNGTELDGATFGLYKDAACTEENKVAEATSQNGVVNFGDAAKLAVGEYYLKELKAPAGYSALTSVVKVVISEKSQDHQQYDFTYSANGEKAKDVAKEGIISLDITNNKGFNLPATGGMGTYLFTIGGLVIMAGAALLLIASKKRRA